MRCKMIVITTMLCVMVACQKGQAKPMPADEDTLKKIANAVLSRPGIKNMTPEQIAILAAGEALLEKQDERLEERLRILDEAFENFQFAKALADIDKARMDNRTAVRMADSFLGMRVSREDVHGVDWIDKFIDELGKKLHPDLHHISGVMIWYPHGITRAAILQDACEGNGYYFPDRSYKESLRELTNAYIDLLSEVIALGN